MSLTLPFRRSLSLPRPRVRSRRSAPHLVIIGNGMAAIRLLEELVEHAPGRHRITVFGAEAQGHYNRVQLSSLLAGDKDVGDILTHPPTWHEAHGITLHAGDPVIAIDPQSHTVTAQSGLCVGWDQLILATGAEPIRPALPGIGLGNVIGFRDLDDVEVMIRASRQGRHAVVVGGGVLGLEAAWGLKARGMEVAVVHMTDTLMERQLDSQSGAMLRQRLASFGIHCRTGISASAFEGEGVVRAVRLSDGSVLPADVAVVAVGIRPRIGLARDAGLQVGRGIVIDDHMRTSHAGILALGECVEFQGETFGLVKPLYDMATVLARDLSGRDGPGFVLSPLSTVLKVPPIPVFAAGQPDFTQTHDDHREVVHHDADQGIYKKVLLRQGKVVGTVLLGDTSDSTQLWHWMRQGQDVGHLDQRALCVGCMGCETDDVGALADDAIVCQCNHVTKGAIVAAIRRHGFTETEQVCKATRAGLTCGQCTVRVTALLAAERGEEGVDLAVLEARLARQTQAFTYWHRCHASLMTVLLFTGLVLHFAGDWINRGGFDWSRRLHEWSGLAVCGGFVVFLGLTGYFRRKWRWGADSLAMFAFMPLITVSGVIFLWPDLVPHQLAEKRTTVWVALAHLSFAILIGMYSIHHLAHAPFRWWAKRKRRRAAVAA